MSAQSEMGGIRRRIRMALASCDHRYFADCARAVADNEEPAVALHVVYPMMSEVEVAFREAVSGAWEHANSRCLGMLRRKGDGVLFPWPPSHATSSARRAGRGETATAGETADGERRRDRNVAPTRETAGGERRRDRNVARTRVSVFASGTGAALKAILEGEDLVVPEESIKRYAQDRIPPLRGVVSEQRKRLCGDIIAQGAREGMSARQLARALEDQGYGSSAFHRETIARTEGTTLYAHGSVARYRASACVTGLRFVAVMDDRTTEECAALNDQVFRVDDVDGVTPPLDFNCRSELEPVLFDETPEVFDTAVGYLSDPATPNPADGFGSLDLQGFPPARDLRDLYAPLAASDRVELKTLYGEIMSELMGGGRWR